MEEGPHVCRIGSSTSVLKTCVPTTVIVWSQMTFDWKAYELCALETLLISS